MHSERRLWQQNPKARLWLYGAVVAAFLAAALWLGLAWLLSQIVAGVFLAHQNLSDVTPWLLLMAALAVVRAGLLWGSEVGAQLSANRVRRDVRARLTAKLLALGPTYTWGERTGELIHAAVQGVEALDEHISQYQPARLLAVLVPALVLGVVLMLDPWTLPILLFAGPILVILFALIGARTQELSARRFQEMAWMSAHFLDVLQGLPTLKMFGRNQEQTATIERISRHFGATTMEVLSTAFQTSLVLEWGATAATALVAIEVSVRLMNGLMPFDLALTVLLLTPEFFAPLRHLAIKYHAGTAGKAAAARIFAILDTPGVEQRAGGSHIVAGGQPPVTKSTGRTYPIAPHDISFRDVYVAYDDGQRPALNGFSLDIRQGEMVALVGPTGAGKTTVANLLLRFVEPARGRVTVGGSDLCRLDPHFWRTQLAWVSQRPHLFYGTVADNLRLANSGAPQAALIAAARAAHAHEFIEQLPNGYDTRIGAAGATLSGGQRQRLAIARAFLKDAPILILDEASSQLDAANEALLRDALAQLVRHRTVIVIAHRLALAYDAGLVAVMDKGCVVEQGDPRTLARGPGAFATLVAAYGASSL